jgi:hypothetical protein
MQSSQSSSPEIDKKSVFIFDPDQEKGCRFAKIIFVLLRKWSRTKVCRWIHISSAKKDQALCEPCRAAEWCAIHICRHAGGVVRRFATST